MTDNKGPDHSRRKERSRRAILEATRALVAEEGYDGVSIEAIASRAGVGKQTIYRRWPSKDAVVFAAILALGENRDGDDIALPDTGDLRADLRLVLRATVEEFTDPAFDRLMRAVNTAVSDNETLAARYREEFARPLDEAKRVRLLSAREAGELSPDADLDLMLETLYAPLFQRWLHRSGPLTAEYADALVDTALRAFGP